MILSEAEAEAGAISFSLVRTTTQGQSVYPDIAFHIGSDCVYCIEDGVSGELMEHVVNNSNMTSVFRFSNKRAINQMTKSY
jgi:hypothetical protein